MENRKLVFEGDLICQDDWDNSVTQTLNAYIAVESDKPFKTRKWFDIAQEILCLCTKCEGVNNNITTWTGGKYRVTIERID
jgi:hypothetical protein